MNHQDILNDIGRFLDIEMTFNEDGQCFFLIDEHLMVTVTCVEDAWILYGFLGKLEVNEKSENVAQTLMTLNLPLAEAGFGSIVVEPASNAIMLILRVATTYMDGQRMQDIFGDFIDALNNTMTALDAKHEPKEQSPTPADAPQGLGIFDRA